MIARALVAMGNIHSCSKVQVPRGIIIFYEWSVYKYSTPTYMKVVISFTYWAIVID